MFFWVSVFNGSVDHVIYKLNSYFEYSRKYLSRKPEEISLTIIIARI